VYPSWLLSRVSSPSTGISRVRAALCLSLAAYSFVPRSLEHWNVHVYLLGWVRKFELFYQLYHLESQRCQLGSCMV
jgi:hypothetical protein